MADKKTDENQEPESKGNKKLIIIMAVAAVVLMVAVGAGAYFIGAKTGSSAAEAETTAEEVEKTEKAPVKAEAPGPMVPIQEFLINLLDKDANRYLKATMTLEVDNDEAAEELQTRMPQIRDAILLVTGNKTYGELHDLQGKMQLRAELIGHLNTLLQHGKVKHIYITNFVIQ